MGGGSSKNKEVALKDSKQSQMALKQAANAKNEQEKEEAFGQQQRPESEEESEYDSEEEEEEDPLQEIQRRKTMQQESILKAQQARNTMLVHEYVRNEIAEEEKVRQVDEETEQIRKRENDAAQGNSKPVLESYQHNKQKSYVVGNPIKEAEKRREEEEAEFEAQKSGSFKVVQKIVEPASKPLYMSSGGRGKDTLKTAPTIKMAVRNEATVINIAPAFNDQSSQSGNNDSEDSDRETPETIKEQPQFLAKVGFVEYEKSAKKKQIDLDGFDTDEDLEGKPLGQFEMNRHSVMVGISEAEIMADGEAQRQIDFNELADILS